MAFDINGAKAAGYSDTEIADHLAGAAKFDAAGARKAGYSDAELIAHLVPATAPAAPTTSAGAVDEFGRSQSGPAMPEPPQAPEPAEPPKDITTKVRDALAPAPDTTYGDILPLAKDDKTGNIRLAMPNMIRSPLIGLTQEGGQATIDPATNTLGIAPEAASVAQFAASPLRFGKPALSPAAIAEGVMAAPTVGDAINVATQAASGAAEVSPQLRLLQQTEAGIVRRSAAAGRLTDVEGIRLENLRAKMATMQQPAVAVEEMPTGTVRPTSEHPPTIEGTALPAPQAATIPKSSAEAKAVASPYYKYADQADGTLTPKLANEFIDEAEKIAPQTPEGQAIAGDTTITGLVQRLQALRDKPISLRGAQEIDERLGDLIDHEYGLKGLSKEGRNILELQSTFREMIKNAGPDDITGGTAGFEALQKGRLAWAQAMKMMDVERILERANQTDNPATGIKSGIRVLTSNAARMRGYSPEEIAALKAAGNRGAIGGLLHVFGNRLAPWFMGAAGLSSGGLPGLLLGTGAAHMGGAGMRNLATKLQTRRADNAMSMLGARVPLQLPDATTPPAP